LFLSKSFSGFGRAGVCLNVSRIFCVNRRKIFFHQETYCSEELENMPQNPRRGGAARVISVLRVDTWRIARAQQSSRFAFPAITDVTVAAAEAFWRWSALP
jgi:hypothetical protein